MAERSERRRKKKRYHLTIPTKLSIELRLSAASQIEECGWLMLGSRLNLAAVHAWVIDLKGVVLQ